MLQRIEEMPEVRLLYLMGAQSREVEGDAMSKDVGFRVAEMQAAKSWLAEA